jgi:iron complex transport system substrate-binding protein
MPRVDRRAFLLQSAAALALPRAAAAATITDGAGRAVTIPERVTKVFAAGPPAAVMLYTLAPDLLPGWPRANAAAACEFLLPDACRRPELGRLTGRDNTINLEAVIALGPELIVDVGSVGGTFASLADRVQGQTGIPYALLDGRLAVTEAVYRDLGRLIHREADAEPLASHVAAVKAAIRERGGRASIMRADETD